MVVGNGFGRMDFLAIVECPAPLVAERARTGRFNPQDRRWGNHTGVVGANLDEVWKPLGEGKRGLEFPGLGHGRVVAEAAGRGDPALKDGHAAAFVVDHVVSSALLRGRSG